MPGRPAPAPPRYGYNTWLATARLHPMTTRTAMQLDTINPELHGKPAEDVIRWASETFGDGLAMTIGCQLYLIGLKLQG